MRLDAPGLRSSVRADTVALAEAMKALDYWVTVINTGPVTMEGNPLVARLAEAGIRYEESSDPEELALTLESVSATIWWGNCLTQYVDAGHEIHGSIYVVHSSGAPTLAMLNRHAHVIHQGAVVGVSGAASKLAEMTLGIEPTTIWNGVDIEAVYPSAGRPFTIGTLGRYSPEKNLTAAIGALRHLPDVRLRCYGWGPERLALAKAAHQLGVEDRFDLCGKVDHPNDALKDFDCLILCSTYEGLPMTVVEAMAAGVPVISVPLGDLPLILKGRGLLCGPTAGAIAGAVKRLQAMTLKDREEMTERAQDYAARYLSAESMAAGYSALIQGVVA